MEQRLRDEAISEVREWCLANGFDDGNRKAAFDKDIPFGIIKIEVRDGFPDNRHESIRFEFSAITCDGQWASMALSEPLSKVLEIKDTVGVDYFMRVPLQRMWNEYFDKVLFKKGRFCRACRRSCNWVMLFIFSIYAVDDDKNLR